jgi:hypothetical protein
MIDQTPNPKTSQLLWGQLVADYRQACLLRRAGREEEARGIVSERLPQTIALWSREDTRPAADKKAALETMFSSEQMNMDSWLFAHQALTSRMAETLIPAIREQVGQEMRSAFAQQAASRGARPDPDAAKSTHGERIRFDDIPGVIDALLAQQAADFSPRPSLTYS